MKKLAAFMLLTLTAVCCSATTILPMSVEELSSAATDIVEANAVRSWSTWNAQHTLIYTFTEFHVARRLKGSAPQQIVVKQMGGHLDGLVQRVAGLRYFQDGEQTLLFLRPSAARDGSQVIVGMMQGNFRVWNTTDGRRMAANGISGASELRGAQVRTFAGSAMDLSQIESRVQKAVRP